MANAGNELTKGTIHSPYCSSIKYYFKEFLKSIMMKSIKEE